MQKFEFVMIGAMYENGGNTTQRFLDGHPELYVYPYESQLGTRLVQDQYSSYFPLKYRWPEFSLSASPTEDYQAIIDEEAKVRTKTPNVSKFRHEPIDMTDADRLRRYVNHLEGKPRSVAANVEAFFRATFDAWKDFSSSGANRVYVGYSPVITIDAEKIFRDLPHAHFIHVVRNPFSAYADTKKRAVPLSLKSYLTGWAANQYHALLYRERYPGRFHLLRFEELTADPAKALQPICERIGIDAAERSLTYPSWNGRRLEKVFPWGTIETPTTAANQSTASELSEEERKEIAWRAGPFLASLDYRSL